MKQLADLLVKPEDGRFARTIVNRLWAQLMGRGIVEPLDDMDQAAWDQDLLDWLAADFVAHGHDLKHTLALIASSEAYRLPSRGVAEPGDRSAYAFRGPLDQADDRRAVRRRRLDRHRRLARGRRRHDPRRRPRAGGAGRRRPRGRRERSERQAARRPPVQVDARWIWSHADAAHDPGGRILVRKVIKLDKVPKSALAVATCDNEVVLYVNGKKVGQSGRLDQADRRRHRPSSSRSATT